MRKWIAWPGGACPVTNGTMVDVKFADGTIHLAQQAHGEPRQANRTGSKAWRSYWQRNGIPREIVEYRRAMKVLRSA